MTDTDPTRADLQAVSAAIDRACANLDRDDPEGAARFQGQRERTAGALQAIGANGSDVVHVEHDRPLTPERDGYTIGVYLPPEATQADIDAIMTRVADAVHGRQYQGQWDPFVIGHAGDWLYVDHHPDQVHDYAAHVRARWNHGTAED